MDGDGFTGGGGGGSSDAPEGTRNYALSFRDRDGDKLESDIRALDPKVKLHVAPHRLITHVLSHRTRPLFVAVTGVGELFVLQPEFSTSFPGPMYPAGFLIVHDNGEC